jgi:ribosomal protein S6--L-glutamate ligase
MTILSFHPCFGADRQIVLGAKPLSRENRICIEEAEAIILPQGCSKELYHACAQSRAVVFPDYRVRYDYPGKMGQARLFRDVALAHPETRCWKNTEEIRTFLRENGCQPHGFPFFLKMDGLHEGEGVFYIDDHRIFEDVFGQLHEREARGTYGFLTQAAVPTRGNALRAVIIGSDVFTFWKRPRGKGGMITSISKGAIIDKKWRLDLQEKAVEETRKLSLQTGLNLAAIDFAVAVEEPNPRPLFLEINYFFARRGLGGTMRYYRYLYDAIRKWLLQQKINPERIALF